MTKESSSTTEQQKLTSSEETTKICENCYARVSGLYCGECGQSVESTLKYFWTVILHLLDDILSFDSRASRTLFPLLFKPGFLTNEYIKGRRVHYVPPLRLYLFVSIVFFISIQFIAENEITIQPLNPNKELSQRTTAQIGSLKKEAKHLSKDVVSDQKLIDKLSSLQQDLLNKENKVISLTAFKLLRMELERIDEGKPLSKKKQNKINELSLRLQQAKQGVKLTEEKMFNFQNNDDGTLTLSFLSDENNKKLTTFTNTLEDKAEQVLHSDVRPLIKESISKLPQLMFVLLPLFALLLKITYFFKNRLYLEHLTVALHSHSFIFLSILLLLLFGLAEDNTAKSYPFISSVFSFISLLLFFWLPIYLFKTQKHIYKQNFVVTLVKYIFIGLVYILLIILTGIIAFIWGLSGI